MRHARLALRDEKNLRAFTTLEEINGVPVARFWKEVDAKKGKNLRPQILPLP